MADTAQTSARAFDAPPFATRLFGTGATIGVAAACLGGGAHGDHAVFGVEQATKSSSCALPAVTLARYARRTIRSTGGGATAGMVLATVTGATAQTDGGLLRVLHGPQMTGGDARFFQEPAVYGGRESVRPGRRLGREDNRARPYKAVMNSLFRACSLIVALAPGCGGACRNSQILRCRRPLNRRSAGSGTRCPRMAALPEA